jgi:hypothetical protein
MVQHQRKSLFALLLRQLSQLNIVNHNERAKIYLLDNQTIVFRQKLMLLPSGLHWSWNSKARLNQNITNSKSSS